jgi:phage-related protein
MAIVGTAFVRLRVIGDKLGKDISDATKKAVQDAAPDLNESGKGAGEHVGEGLGEKVESTAREQMDRIGDQIGDTLGRAMGDALGRSLRRRVGDSFRNGFQGIESKLAPIKAKVQPVFEKFGEDWGKATSKKFEGLFKKALIPGIALIATALPSALAFVGAGVGALAATAVTALASLGPAFAGAGLAGLAAFGTVKIAAGLIGLALKQQTPQLLDYQDRLNKFKTTIAAPIQDGLLSGLNASMRLLGPVVTALQPQLGAIGTAAGDVAIQFADAIRQGAMMDRLTTILDGNARAITGFGTGASLLGQAFIVLFSHLTPIVDYLATGATELGQWALNAILASEASGGLDAFITRMFNSMTFFVGILVDFGAGIANVFRAAFEASGGMIGNLAQVASNFRDWTGDPGNQERMVSFFDRMRVIAAQVLGVLKDIAGAALHGLDGTSVERFSNTLGTLQSLGAPIAAAFRQIQDAAGPQLLVAFQNFVNLITQLANSGVLGTVTLALSNLFAIISTLLTIPGIGQLLAFGAGLLAIYKTVSLLWTVLGPVVNILFAVGKLLFGLASILVEAFGIVPILIAAVVAGLIYFFAFTDTGRAIVAAAWHAIQAVIGVAVDAIVTAFHWVIDTAKELWSWIQTTAQGIWSAVSTAFGAVRDTVMTVFGAVRDFIVGVFSAIWGFVQPILSGIASFFQAVFSVIATIVETYLNIVFAIFSRVFPLLMLPIRIFYGLAILFFQLLFDGIVVILNFLSGVITAIWNAIFAFMSGVIGGVVDVVVAGWNLLYNFVAGILAGLWSVVVGAWNAISDAVSTAMSAVWGVVTAVWNAVSGFIGGVLDAIGSRISSVWSGFSGVVSGALDAVLRVVTSGWNSVVDFVQGALDRIGGIVSNIWGGLESLGSGIVSGLKIALNGVIDAVNVVIGGINDAIDLANKLPGPDIPTIAKIPRLAKGGTVLPTASGTLAMIAEAGRPERVEPLDAQGLSVRDRAIIDRLSGGSNGPANVTVMIGTRELTELVDFVVEEREDNLSDRLLTGTKG